MILLCYLFLLLHTAIGFSEVCQVGECINLENCPLAIRNLKKKIIPTICGFEGLIPNVCCVRMSDSIQNKTISDEKCEEYRHGKKPPKSAMDPAGGTDVQAFGMPHVAILEYGTNHKSEWNCGGALISDNFVLTAAYCAHTRFGDVTVVKLGNLDTSSDKDIATPKVFQVTEIHVHPDYQLLSKYNDLVLLKLNASVEFNEFMRPACLHTTYTITTETLLLTQQARGWGALDFDDEQDSFLLTLDMKHLPKDSCDPFYKPDNEMSKGIIDESQLCAGGDGKYACQGDAGGPIQIKNPGKADSYTVVGVATSGNKCGFDPMIYTRVSHYIPWIESIVWPNKS